MKFLNFLINEAVTGANITLNNDVYNKSNKKYKETMGLTPDPNQELNAIKNTRYKYGVFTIQPPPINSTKNNKKNRIESYKKIKSMLDILVDAVKKINNNGLSIIFTGTPDNDRSPCVVRLIDDYSNDYAAMYQQENSNNNDAWERGDFILNISAKNANLHTIVHEIGHKLYYEVLTQDQKDEWNDYYKLRKYRKKNEFVTKYAMENDREDFSETFAVFIIGADAIDAMYDKRKTNKHENKMQSIFKKFKQIVFSKKNLMLNPIAKKIKKQEDPNKERERRLKLYMRSEKQRLTKLRRIKQIK